MLLAPLAAHAASYSDVGTESSVYPAIIYLRDKGVLQDAEKFNPENKLTREQAAKVIVASIVPAEEIAKVTATSFKDVSGWSVPYVEAARLMGIVKTADTFRPTAPITKSEYIKMLLAAKNKDFAGAFGDLTSPLSSDVNDASAWFFPVMRYAIASSMTAVGQDGTLNPNLEITRAQMALFTYRLAMNDEGRRIQALLSQTEADIGSLLKMLDEGQTLEAEYAAARAVVAARGALASKPDEALVKGAVKVSEGFQLLVLGYKAGAAGELDKTIEFAKGAYAAAEKAEGFSASLKPLTDQMRTIAGTMANEARALKAQVPAQ